MNAEITIPANWAGRAVELDLSRVSTDAIVFANGIECGRVAWPSGTVDITKAVKPGKNTLRIFVLATNNGQEILSSTHSMTQGLSRGQANVANKGIIGDVMLSSRPRGAHVSDVFVQPSTRKGQVALDVELSGVQKAGNVQFVAKMLNEKGVEEKRFTGSAKVKPGTQTVRVAWPWTNARLWELAQPNMYTLRLEAKGAGLDDEYSQEFGFREFWIEGRKFFLNNHEIRLRTETAPISGISEENEGKSTA
jgi:beta-galactosidase